MNELEILKYNVANLGSRGFGEIFAQTLVRELYPGMSKSSVEEYDEDYEGKRVEVKFARATLNDLDINDTTLVDYLAKARTTKLYSINDDYQNIICQSIKEDNFDILIWGAVFDEGIYIFKTDVDTFMKDKELAIGTKADGSWQFAITKRRLRYFKKTYLEKFVNWNQINKILLK